MSYVWLDASCMAEAPDKPTFRVDNKFDIPMTAGLWRAIQILRYWRYRSKNKVGDIDFSDEVKSFFGNTDALDVFWADAVCINQSDAAEKRTEIPRMKNIYLSASRVLASLGAPFPETDIEDVKRVALAGEELLLEHKKGKYMYSEKDFSLRDRFGSHLDRIRDQLEEIINRAWFSRVWVVQELAASREWPVLALGEHLIRCEPLIFLSRLFHNRLLELCPPSFCVSSLQRLRFMSDLREWNLESVALSERPVITASDECVTVGDDDAALDKGEPSSNSDKSLSTADTKTQPIVLKNWSQGDDEASLAQRLNIILELMSKPVMFSTLHHDSIYGILGLSTNSKLPEKLLPDYSAYYPDVCRTYARFIAEKTGLLWFLGFYKQYCFEDYCLGAVPSWVPDFRVPTFYDFDYRNFAENPPVPQPGSVVFSDNGNIMTVQGSNMTFGRIVRVWRKSQKTDMWCDPSILKKKLVQRWKRYMLQASARCTGATEEHVTHLWLRGVERSRQPPTRKEVISELDTLKRIWSKILLLEDDVEVTWQMDSFDGEVLSRHMGETLFVLAAQITSRDIALSADGTFWKIVDEAGSQPIKRRDIPVLIRGYTYDLDCQLEVAAVLREQRGSYKYLGFMEGSKDKTDTEDINWRKFPLS